MSFWTAIVVIAAIWACVAVIRSRNNTQLGYGTDEEGNPIGNPRREEELRQEIADLHERLKVLERIATDDREARRLSAEIDELRDRQPPR